MDASDRSVNIFSKTGFVRRIIPLPPDPDFPLRENRSYNFMRFISCGLMARLWVSATVLVFVIFTGTRKVIPGHPCRSHAIFHAGSQAVAVYRSLLA
jgi:hypothetical protein